MHPRGLAADERGIEGLPIRLVIALVVGVASLGVMMNTLGGIQALGSEELDVAPSPEVTGPGHTDLAVSVVGPEGERISNATVVAKSGTAQLDSIRTATTNGTGVADVAIDPSLGQNQAEGTIEFDVKPPAGSQYVDDRQNTEVLIVN